jgi:hypothetical protein
MEQLKKNIVIFGRKMAIYGNSCALQEKRSLQQENALMRLRRKWLPPTTTQFRRWLDNMVQTLVLLPMNTTKSDVYEYVNLKAQKICDRGGISKTTFWKLWREEYPYVQIPPYLQFSKCFHFWKYKCSMEATTNTLMKTQIKRNF